MPQKNIGTLWNFTKHLHQNPPGPHKVSAPEPSRTSPSIFSAKTLRNLTRSAPEHSGTSQGICPGTLQNLTTNLHLDPPEPHQVAAPETSGTSQGISTGTLRNLTGYLHQNPPEPCPEPGVEAAPDRSGATNLG